VEKRRLLAESARSYLQKRGLARVALDVILPYSIAAGWYQRLGFTECSRAAWWLSGRPAGDDSCARGCPEQPAAARFRSQDLLEADRLHHAWGFSSFTARDLSGSSYQVGRLYAPYFRLPDVAAARDRDLLRWLGSLDPARRLLLTTPAEMPSPVWKQVASSRRLECRADGLLARLAEHSRPHRAA